MKTSLRGKMTAAIFALTVLGSAAAMADDDDYRGYRDWDHTTGWHHHHDNRVYYTGPRGYYEPNVVYQGVYPEYVPPPTAYYAPYEPGFSINIH